MSKKRKKTILSKAQIENTLRQVFLDNPVKNFNFKQLLGFMGGDLDRNQKIHLEAVLDKLLHERFIVNVEPTVFKLNNESIDTVHGTVVNIVSFGGFVRIDGRPDEDLFVATDNLMHALLEDRVEVVIYEGRRRGRIEGSVVSIVKRSERRYVGVLEVSKQYAFFIADGRRMPYDVFIPLKDLNGGQNDNKVIVEIADWPEYTQNPIGKVVEVLGLAGENNAEMHAILAEYGLPYHFTKEIEDEADNISDKITKKDISSRRDMRGIPTFTIDPADAKDFDDALSIRKMKDNVWEVGVHIADVTHYVKDGSELNREALERATSVYLVDRVVPMLPERLSNGLCSLRPDEDKLCFSAIFELDEEANLLSEWFGRTIVRSTRRFAYEEAQAVIETKDGDMKDEILTLNSMAKAMRKARYKHGSIAFERDEVKFKLDDNGKPQGVYFKEIKESNHLIEEFMLLANRKVAEFVGKNQSRTFVYRVHDKPNIDKFEDFKKFVYKFGYELSAKTDRAIARELNKLLNSIKGSKVENLFSTLALRSMSKAVYSTDNLGHYGLAFDFYTHFTSPIRRYPDMMVHRLLQHYLDNGASADKEYYEDMCKHSSEREVRASEAERSSIKYKMVEFLQDKLDQEFDGYISGVTEWGVYVELSETKIEGMVSMRDMTDDFYEFDEKNYRIMGARSRRVFTLGDNVRVKVLRTDLKRKQIDYELVGCIDFDTKNVSYLKKPTLGKYENTKNTKNRKKRK